MKVMIEISSELYDRLKLEGDEPEEVILNAMDLRKSIKATLSTIDITTSNTNDVVNRVRNLRLGERVARLETMASNIERVMVGLGTDLGAASRVIMDLPEWRSMNRWGRVKRFFSR